MVDETNPSGVRIEPMSSGLRVDPARVEPEPPVDTPLTRPPQVGDRFVYMGRESTVTGTQVRGSGDFSVMLQNGDTVHTR